MVQEAKKSLKMHKNCFYMYRDLESILFSWGDSPTPPPPPSLMIEGIRSHTLPNSCLRSSENAYDIQLPYHFPKAGNGHVLVILDK